MMNVVQASLLVGAGDALMFLRAPDVLFADYRGQWQIDLNWLDRAIPTEAITDAERKLGAIKEVCLVLGCGYTVSQIDRTLSGLRTPQCTLRSLGRDCRVIQDRLFDDLESKVFLRIDPLHVPYYNNFVDGWASVIDRFPSVAQDIEEASKCFALNRYTGCVFHLMRISEAGLRVLAGSLDDDRLNPKSNPNWERILRRCREELAKPLGQRSLEWKADEPFFSSASAMLMGVKDAWRNPTMHVERIYTEETALDVFNHVKALMRHLATKLSED